MANSYPGASGILGEPPAPLRRFNPRVVGKIPVGEATEIPAMTQPPRPAVPAGTATAVDPAEYLRAERPPLGTPQASVSPRTASWTGPVTGQAVPSSAGPAGWADPIGRPAPTVSMLPVGEVTEHAGAYGKGMRAGVSVRQAGDAVGAALRSPIGQAASKTLGVAGAGLGAYETGSAAARGDWAGAAGGAADLAAGGAMALGGPVTATLGGAWMLGRGIRSGVQAYQNHQDDKTLANGLPTTNPLGESAHTPRSMYGAALNEMPLPTAMHVPQSGPPQPPGPPTISGAAAVPNGFGSEVEGVPGAYRIDAPGKNPLYTDLGQPMTTGYSTNAIGGAPGSPGSAFTASALRGPDGNYNVPAAQDQPQAQGPAGTDPGRAQMLQSKMLDMVQNQAKYGGTAVVRQAIAAMQPMLDQALGNGAGTIAGMREGGDMARARMQQGTTLRGQDLDMFGKQLSSQTTRAIARMEQMQKDRAYGLDVEKFGLDVAKQRLTQRDSNASALKSWLEATHVDADGKPDAAKIATYTRGINSYLDAQVQRAQQLAQAATPGSPEQRAALEAVDQLQQGGVNALDPTRKQQLLKALEVQSKAAEGHSAFNPFKPTYKHSDNPMDYMITGERKGVIQDDYTTANGTVIPKRMINIRDGGVLPTGIGVQDQSFEPIKRTIRQ